MPMEDMLKENKLRISSRDGNLRVIYNPAKFTVADMIELKRVFESYHRESRVSFGTGTVSVDFVDEDAEVRDMVRDFVEKYNDEVKRKIEGAISLFKNKEVDLNTASDIADVDIYDLNNCLVYMGIVPRRSGRAVPEERY